MEKKGEYPKKIQFHFYLRMKILKLFVKLKFEHSWQRKFI